MTKGWIEGLGLGLGLYKKFSGQTSCIKHNAHIFSHADFMMQSSIIASNWSYLNKYIYIQPIDDN